MSKMRKAFAVSTKTLLHRHNTNHLLMRRSQMLGSEKAIIGSIGILVLGIVVAMLVS